MQEAKASNPPPISKQDKATRGREEEIVTECFGASFGKWQKGWGWGKKEGKQGRLPSPSF